VLKGDELYSEPLTGKANQTIKPIFQKILFARLILLFKINLICRTNFYLTYIDRNTSARST